jgi:hypothetical protein
VAFRNKAGGFPGCQTRPVEGIYVGTHTLTKQAEQLESLTRRVGNRLSLWLKRTSGPNDDPNANPLPSPEWIESFRYYQAAVLGLLKEQRERAKLKAGEDITDDELQKQFREEMAKALESFTPKEREFAIEMWSRMTPGGKPAKATEEVQ